MRPLGNPVLASPLQFNVHDNGDAELIAQIAAQTYTLNPIVDDFGLPSSCNCADVNSDGQVTVLDSLAVSQAVQGINPITQRCPAMPTPPRGAALCLPGSQLGDVDGDGDIDMIDARIVAEITAQLRPLPADLCCMDTHPNGAPNGIIDILDALLIVQEVQGVVTLNGPGCPIPPTPQANLSVTKEANVTLAAPGDFVLYTINLTNTGNADALNVLVTDTIPVDMTYITSEPIPTNINLPDVTWTVDVPAGGYYEINLTVQINVNASLGPLVNSVSVDNGSINITDDTTIIVIPPPNNNQPLLTVDKVDNPDPVQNGTELNYTITITNIGLAPALNVVATETYPAGVSFVGSNPNPDFGTDNVWTFIAPILPGGSRVIDITVLVDPNLVNGTILDNLVDVTYENTTSTLVSSDRENTTVIGGPIVPQLPNIDVSKVANVSVVNPGESILYTVLLNNTGGFAENVTVVENYPPFTYFITSVPVLPVNYPVDNNTFFFNISANTIYELNITLQVDPNATLGTQLFNFVNITYPVNGTNMTNMTNTTNSTNVTDTLPPTCIVLGCAPNPADLLQSVTCSVDLTDPRTVDNVTADVTRPDMSVFAQTVTPGTGNGTHTFTFTNTDLNGTYVVDWTFNDTLNNVGACQDTFDVMNFSAFPPNIEMNKTANVSEVNPGENILYTITLNNTGGFAENVTIVENYPNFTSFVGSVPVLPVNYPVNNNTFFFNITPSTIYELNITLQVDPNTPLGTMLDNFVNITYPVNGTNMTNMTNTTNSTNVTDTLPPTCSVPVCVPGVANLSQSVVCSVDLTDPRTVDNVTADVTMPNGTMLVQSVSPGTGNGTHTFTFTNTDLVGTYDVLWTANDTLNNVGTCQGTFDVINFSNTPPNIILSKNSTMNSAAPGDLITYQITLNNTGGDAFNVSVTDTYPGQTSYISAQPVPINPPANNNWLVDVPAASTYVINVTLQIDANATIGTNLTNFVNITYDNGTSNITNATNTSNNPITIVPQAPYITLNKTSNVGNASPGEFVQYMIALNNTGGPAYNVTVVDTIPLDTIYNSSQPTPFNMSGQDITWVVDILGMSTYLINLTLQIGFNATIGDNLTNFVTITYDNGTANVTNSTNTSGNPITIVPPTNDTTSPSIFIISPIDNAIYNQSNISVNINATDNSGIPPTVTYTITGPTNAGPLIYSGLTSFIFAPDGVYTLTAFAVDAVGNNATAAVTFTVNQTMNATNGTNQTDLTPVVTINANQTQGTTPFPVNFTCSVASGNPLYIYAYDFGDGTSVSFGPTALTTFSFTKTYLTTGTFLATCTVTDTDLDTATAGITITVNGTNITNTNPDVNITSPLNGSTFSNATLIGFNSLFFDVEDGVVPTSITWFDSLQGTIGATQSFARNLATPGTHTIMVTAYDNDGAFDTDTITIFIIDPAAAPPVLDTTKTSNSTTVGPGELVYYTINITNTGGNAQNVSVVDTIPLDTTFNISQPTPSSINGQNITWVINVPALSTYLINLTVGVNLNATIGENLTNFVAVTYNNGTANITNSTNTSNNPVTVTDNTGMVEGFVEDSNNFIYNATVQAIRSGVVINATNTDANGYYNVTGLPQGPYTLRVSKTGYTQNNTGITIVFNTTTQQNVTLYPLASSGAITGTVYDFPGFATVPNAWIEVRVDSTGELIQIVGSTAIGTYRVNGLPNVNSYTINATAPGLSTMIFGPVNVFVPAGGVSTMNDIVLGP